MLGDLSPGGDQVAIVNNSVAFKVGTDDLSLEVERPLTETLQLKIKPSVDRPGIENMVKAERLGS